MITQVDCNKTHVIQKVTGKKGKPAYYQVVELPAGDSLKVRIFDTLMSARAAIGKTAGGKTVH